MEDKHASNAYIGIIILNLDVKNVLIEPVSKVLNWTSSKNFIIFIASNTLVKKRLCPCIYEKHTLIIFLTKLIV